MSIRDAAGNVLTAAFTGQVYTVDAASTPGFSSSVLVNALGKIGMGIFAQEGAIPSGYGLRVGSFATNTAILNTWGDGSARHMILYYDATSLGFNAISTIPFNNGTAFTPSWPTASVAFTIGGTTYTANLGSFDSTNTLVAGNVARRAWKLMSLGSHPNLQVMWDVTSYASGGHRLSITLQNIKNISTCNSFTGNLVTTVNGSTFADMTKSSFTIFTGNDWTRIAFTGMTEADASPNFDTWISANVIPRFIGANPATYVLDPTSNPAYALGGGPYLSVGTQTSFGEATGDVATSENSGRQELNPWCDWEARYFLTGQKHYRDTILANANQAGGWSAHISKDSTGLGILRLDEDTNYANINTDIAAPSGLQWPINFISTWTGAISGGGTPGYPANNVNYNREHVSDMVTVAYWLTGDIAYLYKIMWQASWTLFQSYIPTSEVDPNIWAGWAQGRTGILGLLNDAEMGRSFGRPLKLVMRAAFSMSDAFSAERTYFKTYSQNNLDRVGQYIAYLDSKSWGGSWAQFVGYQPSPYVSWGYIRSNTVSSTTGANPTVVTVIGDNSGVGVGTNDWGGATGDYVTLSGFSGGASGLNGRLQVTRINATSFSVAVNTTGSPTSGVGNWETARGWKSPHWRNSVTSREIAWAGFTGFFTMNANIWAFVDRMAQTAIAVQDNPTFDTTPGVSYNYYPTNGVVVGNNWTFVNNWTDFQATNTPGTNTAPFLDSQGNYTVFGSTTHRGNIQGWNDFNPNSYYTTYALVTLAQGAKRGVVNASAAFNRLQAASDVLTELMRRPGFFFYYGS